MNPLHTAHIRASRLLLTLLALTLAVSSASAQKKKKATPAPPPAPVIDYKTEQMLEGMEKVLIFDSLVVSRRELLRAYPLTLGAGTLAWANADDCEQGTTFTTYYGSERYQSQQVDSLHRLLTRSYHFGSEWTSPEALFDEVEDAAEGDSVEVRQLFPFLMSDGVTLYFAQNTADGLGGLDIYMTRKGGEDRQFYRPENVGMPFNSPANDYFMAIDEELGFGCFATDRHHGADSVCVYYFLPNSQRDTYAADEISREQRESLAAIRSLSDSWAIDEPQAMALREKLKDAFARAAAPVEENTSSREQAQRALAEMEESLLRLRSQWHGGKRSDQLRDLILELEQRVIQQRKAIR